MSAQPSQAPGEETWERIARAASIGAQTSSEVQVLREFLTFRLAGTPYAVPVERVREIVRMRPLTPVPRVPASLVGVISLRGEIVEVIDVRPRLGMPSAEITRATRIVVLHGDDGRTSGLLVDGVSDVLRVTEEALRRDASGDSGRIEALCVRGAEFVSILDLERVLDLDDDR
jgi:purine-binding chemotaxis protein CheW